MLTSLADYCQPAVSKLDLYVTVVLNVATDIYLMSIPLPMLWGANLEKRRKISLMLIFAGGIFVMAAGILRCALIIGDPMGGAQAAGSWAVRETFVAVVIGNLPMIYPLLRRGVERVYSSSGLSRMGRTSQNNNLDDSFPLKSGSVKQGHCARVRSVHPLPTTWNDEGDLEEFGDQKIITRTKSMYGKTEQDGIMVTKVTKVESVAGNVPSATTYRTVQNVTV